MAAAAQDLTTIASVKSLLNITATTWDVILQSLVTSASDFINRYLNRDLLLTGSDVTEYFDGGFQTLRLARYPVASITSISVRSGDYNNPTWTPYSAATEFIQNPLTGEIHFAYPLPSGKQNIRVLYKGGYNASGGIPTDLDFACQKFVAKEYLKRASQGVTNERIGEAGVNWMDGMDAELKMLLDPFRNIDL